MTSQDAHEKALRYVREDYTLSSHDKKHIRRLKAELIALVKLYEKIILKHGNHNWYPHNPKDRAVMEAATKQLVKERCQVIRAAKRLLELIG